MTHDSSSTRLRAREAAVIALVALLAALLLLGASALRDRRSGDRFDLLRWERVTLANRWLYQLGAPLRHDPTPDEAIARYFAASPGSAERRRLANSVEAAIAGRIDAVLREAGVRGRVPLPGSVFPPVNFELAAAPRVLVESPRRVIERTRTELLRPNLTTADAVALESAIEAHDASLSALIVPSGGLAVYPAVVADNDSYAGTVQAAGHEWTHHYLTFYPLGFHYFDSADATAINETVADLVGDAVSQAVLARWGDPTRPAAPVTPTPSRTPAVDVNVVLRDLRVEVDGLLAQGQVEPAEARMEAVREQLDAAGVHIRRINQAYFAWYGTYAARPDAVDPLGGQLREVEQRSGSLAAFLDLVRGVTSRADVERQLDRLRTAGGG